jgi:two-component system, OmpR family, response regulator RegX3
VASGRERFLIVTANDGLARAIQRSLEEYGYVTEVVRDCTRVADAVRKAMPKVVLVERRTDVHQLRREPLLRKIPIAVIEQPEAQCEEDACLDDLERGADASICGVGYREMVARIRALARREELLVMMAERYDVGNLHMDTVRHEVAVGGRAVELTPKEFQILLQLVQHPSKVFTRDELLNLIWGEGYALEQYTLHSLRQKIEPDPARPKYIVTVRGIGYKLRQP